MFKNILKGLSAYRQSLALINELRLWKYFLVPMAISLLFGGVIFLCVYGLSDNIGRGIAHIWFWEWGKEAFLEVSTWLGALIILILGFILYKHVVMALSAPFMSPVSERIEKHLFPELHEDIKHRNTSNTQQLIRGLRINVRNLIYEICITLPLLVLSFVPGVNFAATPLSFLVQSYYAGFGNMDYTLERHFSYRESVNFVKQSRGYAIGNGIVFMAMLFIPVIGIILVLPISVTAASKSTLELLRERKLLLESQNDITTTQKIDS
ncbi:EI24 domain-containing protein [Nonlabens xiamenensis]|uniref:EI24 domain-containing protein n=1 Tax=Nonlabens xiamenensis TaxID=2341043 RepID=UPI000F60DDE2|nr:EI24 domain-containing protein [Nonlabens xiamenensis]